MSENEFSNNGNVPDEHAAEEPAGREAGESLVSRDDEVHEAEHERRPLETESRDSDHDSPLEGAIRNSGHDLPLEAASRNLGRDSPLEGAVINSCDGSPCEGAVRGALDDNNEINDSRKSYPPGLIKSGKEDLFRKFFDKEYDVPSGMPIPGRRRHFSEVQTPRQRHASEDMSLSRLSEEIKLSDPNLLGCLQDVGTSSGALLNQAGAIIGKYIPKEDIPDFQRFGTEFGQSLPLTPRKEDSDRSISSVSTARILDICEGLVSRPPSDDSRGLSPGSSFPSFSSRPATAGSDNFKTYSPPNSDSPQDDKLSPPAANHESSLEEPSRQRRLGVITEPVQIRSKSALAGYACYAGESTDDEPKRKLSKDMSVCSDPLPDRRITQDSSINYEQISLEDETIHYPELSHSFESDLCLPMPDLDPAAVASLQENFDILTISSTDIVAGVEEQDATQEITGNEIEHNLAAAPGFTSDAATSEKPQSS